MEIMSSPKPTIGYRTRTEAIFALRGQGLTDRTIAERLGISTGTISALEHSAARAKSRAKRPAEEHGRTIVFQVDVLDRLAPHAAKRGITVNSLVRKLIDTIADECLVDSVMDDLEEIGDFDA